MHRTAEDKTGLELVRAEDRVANSVGFGESANDEMCFFWTYYYPSKGAFVCAHTDQYGGFDRCCPGNPLCSQLLP